MNKHYFTLLAVALLSIVAISVAAHLIDPAKAIASTAQQTATPSPMLGRFDWSASVLACNERVARAEKSKRGRLRSSQKRQATPRLIRFTPAIECIPQI